VTDHINFILLGLGNGAVFAALAMTLVVTYRSSGVVNFASGAMALFAAYTYAFFRTGDLFVPIPGLNVRAHFGSPLGLAPAMALTLALQAVLGVVLYLIVFRPLRNHLSVAKAVASLGPLVMLTAVLNYQAGGTQVIVAPIFHQTVWTVGGVRILSDRIWFVVAIVAVAALLSALYRYTRFGLATRAAAETEFGALVSGLSPERIAIINWALAAVVAGFAGILISPLVALVPYNYTLFIVPALAAAVLGRFNALLPAVAGGLLIGVLQSEAVFLQTRYSWFPKNGVSELIPLVIVLVVLLVRGRPLPTRGMIIERTLGRAPRPHSVWTPAVIGTTLCVIALYTFSESYRAALIVTLIFAVISLSLVVVTGYVGQISLAQLTLAGVAAFTLSRLTYNVSIPFPISPILAALAATAVGVVVGLPALRIRGMLVAVVTLTLAVALEAFWFLNPDLDGGFNGAPIAKPSLFGLDLGIGTGKDFPRPQFGLLCLAVLVAVAVGVAKLRTSRLGSAMLAVKANERSAAAAGISVVRIKLVGFAIGAFIAGLGGCLLAYKQTNVTAVSFSAILGLGFFATAFLAGITSVSGGLLAGFIAADGLIFVFLSRAFDIGKWYGIVSGIGLIVTVIVNPDGIVGPAHATINRRRDDGLELVRLPARSTLNVPPTLARAQHSVEEPESVLTARDLTVRYGGVHALDQVSLNVAAGQILGVIGPNGAGKTTLLDALCGFARCDGTVELSARCLNPLAPHQRARQGLARTFQGVDLYEDLTVEENVRVGQHVMGHDQAELGEVLQSLNLSDVRQRLVSELPQGHRQLVSVARALAGNPRVLLLDEPAAGLDTAESQWLAGNLAVLRDRGLGVVLVDHDMHFVLGLCDSIVVLDFGKVLAVGTPDQIRRDPDVAAAYLGATHAVAASAAPVPGAAG
jgi:sulfate-transporting ATPase